MPRDKKDFRLIPLDDPEKPPAAAAEVVRLETDARRTRPPTRGVPTDMAGPGSKPGRQEAKLARDERRPEKNMAALMEQPAAIAESPEEQWTGGQDKRGAAPWGWFALVGLAAAGGVAWSLSGLRGADEEAVRERAAASETIRNIEEDYRATEIMVDRLHGALAAYCRAATVDDLAKLVRHPRRVRPLMEEYYRDREISSTPLEQVTRLEPTLLEGRSNFWVARLNTGGRTLNLLLEVNDEDVKIDWETAVCHQPMDWDLFATERPAGSHDFRVFLDPDNLYSHEFVNAAQWQCFRLTALDSEEFLYGYARKESEPGRRLTEMLQRSGGRQITLLLRLGVPEGLNSPRGLVIERIISPFWVHLDDPDGENAAETQTE